MKKVTLTGKLSLNKETIAKLNDNQMNQVNGGGSQNHISCSGCDTVYTCPPISIGTCPVQSLAACPPNPTIIGCITLDPPTITGC